MVDEGEETNDHLDVVWQRNKEIGRNKNHERKYGVVQQTEKSGIKL